MFSTQGLINLSDPVNRQHPLLRGRKAWWMVLPPRDGGRLWGDLVGENHALMTGAASTWGWRSTTRPGGFGHMLMDATAGHDLFAPSDPLDERANAFDGPPITIAAWFCPKTVQLCGILDNTNAGIAGALILGGGAGNPLTYYWEITADEYNAASGLTVSAGTWYFGAVSITATAATVYLGQAGQSKLLSFTNTKSHTTKTMIRWQIGSDRDSFMFDGALDDLWASNVAHSASELQEYFYLSQQGYPGMLNRINLARPSVALYPRATSTIASRIGDGASDDCFEG